MYINLRYIGPRITWEPHNLPLDLYHSKGPVEFRTFFKMDYTTFDKPVTRLKTKYNNYSRMTTSHRELFAWKLKIYVRFLAREDCLNSLKITFGCCKETVCSSIHNFRKLLLNSFSDAFAIYLEDKNALKTSRKAVFNVICLDGFSIMVGTHFPIWQLPKDST